MVIYVNLHAGIGKPLWEVTLGEFSIWFKFSISLAAALQVRIAEYVQGIVATAFIYPAMSGAIRTSILLFYLRIFCRTAVEIRWGGIHLSPTHHDLRDRLLHCPGHCLHMSLSFVAPNEQKGTLQKRHLLLQVLCGTLRYQPWSRLASAAASNCTGYAAANGTQETTRSTGDVPLGTSYVFSTIRNTYAATKDRERACIAATYKLGIYVSQWGQIGDLDIRCTLS